MTTTQKAQSANKQPARRAATSSKAGAPKPKTTTRTNAASYRPAKKKAAKAARGPAPVILLVAALLLILLAVVVFRAFSSTRQRVQLGSYPMEYSGEVERWAREYGVDPRLVFAVIRTESAFDPEAQSSAGAIGLMQMTSDTFDWVKGKIAPGEELGFEDLYRPEVAIRFGTYYLSMCLERYGGDVSTAAAAYHSGWGTVDTLLEDAGNTADGVSLTSFPFNQMNHYVNKINQSYEKYKEIY